MKTIIVDDNKILPDRDRETVKKYLDEYLKEQLSKGTIILVDDNEMKWNDNDIM